VKLLYITPRDFPRRVANRVQTMKMTEAFGKRCDVVLCVSKLNVEPPELWDYYGITKPFPIHQMGEPPFGSITLYSLLPALWQIRRHKPDIVYFREEYIGWFLSLFIKNYVFDMISFEEKFRRLYPRLVRRSRKTLVTTEGLRSAAIEAGLDEAKFALHRQAVDLDHFDIDLARDDARRQVGLPLDQRLVLYSGRLSAWKGVDTLLESAAHLPENVKVMFLGGFEGEPETLQRKADDAGLTDRVIILGNKPHGHVPIYLKAADVLMLPNLPLTVESTTFTSPLKLFEYMAAQRPIVASDLPSIREIVDDESAVLVTPGEPRVLAAGIEHALSGGPQVDGRVANAYERAQNSGWDARAERILASVTSNGQREAG
jgi:glycosyltransferase involved in cell wall biosynthesis